MARQSKWLFCVLVLMAELISGCPREAPLGPQVQSTAPALVAASARVEAPVPRPPDLMQIERLPGRRNREWTLFYKEQVAGWVPRFVMVKRSPKGGFVALGIEGNAPEIPFVLRLSDEGSPMWARRLGLQFDVSNSDMDLGEDGSIAVLGHESETLAKSGGGVAMGDSPVLVLVILGESGDLRKVIASREEYESWGKVTGFGGYITTALNLFDPNTTDVGFAIVGLDGRLVSKEVTGFTPVLLSGGKSFTVIGKGEAAYRYRSRVAIPPMPKGPGLQRHGSAQEVPVAGSPYLITSYERDGTLRWAQRLSDPRFHEPSALVQDDRAHVFAAFRYGLGLHDDITFAGLVLELDERGREVRRFSYEPIASVSKMFPSADGLTVLGFAFEGTHHRGKPLSLPARDPASGSGLFPMLFMRVADDGVPIAQLHRLDIQQRGRTPTGLTTIADAAPAGDRHLVVLGDVTEHAPFAGIHVAKAGRPQPYIAKVERP